MLLKTRRAVVAIPFATWFKAYGQPTVVRPEVYSAAGQAMLAKYAVGVAKMRSTAEKDPTSWVFQWYTHAVRPDKGKAAELLRVYPGADPKKALAQDMWNSCQAHGMSTVPPQKQEYFLPWHRMFVFFFERIVRKACADPNFALPYWNYSAPGANHGIIPPSFRSAGPLFESKRSGWVNQGKPIDRTSATNNTPNGDLSLDVLKESKYLPSGASSGFCATIDGGLHGNVHVDVGGPKNMGSVPWAAEDPIFWLHHANIDRLWESWNVNGGKNPITPSFLAQKFVFADENGNRVQMAIQDVLKISALLYRYDRLEPAPPGFAPSPAGAVISAAPSPIHRAVSVRIGAVESKAPLKAIENTPANRFSNRIRNLPSARHLYLRISGLSAQVQPAVLYDVYLNLPAAAAGDAREAFRVGSINFFDAGGHDGHSAVGGKTFTFDITTVARRLAANGSQIEEPVVSVIPRATPEAGAETVIGEISLIED